MEFHCPNEHKEAEPVYDDTGLGEVRCSACDWTMLVSTQSPRTVFQQHAISP